MRAIVQSTTSIEEGHNHIINSFNINILTKCSSVGNFGFNLSSTKVPPLNRKYLLIAPALAMVILAATCNAKSDDDQQPVNELDVALALDEGRQIFRFDTFGDESFWGDTLRLHQAIEGTWFGGVGQGLNLKTALATGLKVEVDALPDTLVAALKHGQVNLDDPALTLELLRMFSEVVHI